MWGPRVPSNFLGSRGAAVFVNRRGGCYHRIGPVEMSGYARSKGIHGTSVRGGLLLGEPIVVPEGRVYHKEDSLEVRVGTIVRGCQKMMVCTCGFPIVLIVVLALRDTTSLERNMSEGPRPEVHHISRLGNHHRVGTEEVETIQEDVVDTSELDVLDPTVPNDLRYKIHNRNNSIRTGRHHKHTADIPGVKLVALGSCLLNEVWSN